MTPSDSPVCVLIRAFVVSSSSPQTENQEDLSVHVLEGQEEWFSVSSMKMGCGDTPCRRVLQSAYSKETNQKFRMLQSVPPQWIGPFARKIVNVAASSLPNGKIVLWSGENEIDFGRNSGMALT